MSYFLDGCNDAMRDLGSLARQAEYHAFFRRTPEGIHLIVVDRRLAEPVEQQVALPYDMSGDHPSIKDLFWNHTLHERIAAELTDGAEVDFWYGFK